MTRSEHASAPLVVGLDGSERDLDALALARRLARALGAPIVAVHVFPGPEGPPPPADDDPARLAAEALLEHGIQPLGGVAAWTMAVPGHDVPRVLKRVAMDERAPMLVIAASHHGALGRIAPGSVPERILHDAPCAVAVAPKGYWEHDLRPHTVGVAWHADPTGATAARVAAAVARDMDAVLEVLTVAEPPLSAGALAMGAPMAAVEAREAARETLSRDLEELKEQLDGGGRVFTRILDGARVPELAGATEHLSLLVVGTHARGPAAELLAGGVSGPLTRHSRCPLLIVPPAGEAALMAALEHTGASA